MAMTLRMSDEDTAALRARADADGQSMQEVAVNAIRAYLDGKQRADIIDAALRDTITRYPTTLRRLGE